MCSILVEPRLKRSSPDGNGGNSTTGIAYAIVLFGLMSFYLTSIIIAFQKISRNYFIIENTVTRDITSF